MKIGLIIIGLATAVKGDFFDRYRDTTAGPATSYLDPSNPTCLRLDSDNLVEFKNTTVEAQFATKKFVLGAEDLCTSGLLYSSCEPVAPIVKSLVSIGLRVSHLAADNPIGSGQFRDAIANGSDTGRMRLQMASFNKDGVGSETLAYPVRAENNIESAVQAVSFATEHVYQTEYHIHGIPDVNSTALENLEQSRGANFDASRLIQGLKVSFGLNVTNRAKLTMDYEKVASVIAGQWLNYTQAQNMSNFFAFVNDPAWGQINLRIEPSQYGFGQRNHTTYVCGRMGPKLKSSSDKKSTSNDTVASTMTNAPGTAAPTTATTTTSTTKNAAATHEQIMTTPWLAGVFAFCIYIF